MHFLLWYARARAAGMPALPRGDRDVLTAWVERVLLGYWTHSGFLNWDSGLGLKRWQIGKTFAFAQQGLLAIARADDFHARPEFGAWAKYFFDRGLALYTRWADEEGGGTLAPPWLNGVHAEMGGGDESKILFGARMAANAARAIDLGLGERSGPGAAAGLRLRPRHRAPGRLDAQPTRPPSWPPTTAPSATAASSSPASTTATGGRSRPSAAARRRPSGSSCATWPTARCWPRRRAA